MREIHSIRNLPYNSITVAPSLLAADFSRLAEGIKSIEDAGAELLHLDIMDGHLVPNISFGPPVIKALRPHSKMIFDTHLMITDPLKYVKSFADSGSDHLTFHIECNDNPDDVIKAINDHGMTAGLTLKPGTPASTIIPYLDRIDMVLIMSVEPGFGGQSFMIDMMPKVSEIRRAIQVCGRPVHLEIDGGIDEKTVHTASAAGAAMMVAGTAVFRHPLGPTKAIELLRAAKVNMEA